MYFQQILYVDENISHISAKHLGAGLSALFGISFAALKGLQLKDKPDTRTGMEMGGALMGGIANIMDYRIKAYELTIAKGQPGLNLFNAPKMVGMTDEMHAKTLKAMRVTSFGFLLPASMISVFWGAEDAWVSIKRNDIGLAAAQVASVIGTIFSLGSSWMALIGPIGSIPPFLWGLAVAVVGVIGVVLTLGAILLIFILQDKEWERWLRDCPLHKSTSHFSSPPMHRDLKETLEALESAQVTV